MILDRILRHKRREVAASKKRLTPDALRKKVGRLGWKRARFEKALRSGPEPAVIAEIKKRSPSKGLLRRGFKPAALARRFERSGASALSVLTDKKFFGGSGDVFRSARRASRLPILRKDFIVDEYQIWESRLWGADAVLLIAAALSKKELLDFSRLADRLGLDCLFEAHSAADLRKICAARPKLVGINNRDLRTFRVDLKTTARLRKKVPKRALLVSESGIRSRKDLERLASLGVRAVLVGESLMREKHPGRALQKLLGTFRGPR